MTGQSNWCESRMPCDTGNSAADGWSKGAPGECAVQHWCVCQWEFASYLQSAGGCEHIKTIVCEATNIEAYLAYRKPESAADPHIAEALRCLEQQCGLPSGDGAHVAEGAALLESSARQQQQQQQQQQKQSARRGGWRPRDVMLIGVLSVSAVSAGVLGLSCWANRAAWRDSKVVLMNEPPPTALPPPPRPRPPPRPPYPHLNAPHLHLPRWPPGPQPSFAPERASPRSPRWPAGSRWREIARPVGSHGSSSSSSSEGRCAWAERRGPEAGTGGGGRRDGDGRGCMLHITGLHAARYATVPCTAVGTDPARLHGPTDHCGCGAVRRRCSRAGSRPLLWCLYVLFGKLWRACGVHTIITYMHACSEMRKYEHSSFRSFFSDSPLGHRPPSRAPARPRDRRASDVSRVRRRRAGRGTHIYDFKIAFVC